MTDEQLLAKAPDFDDTDVQEAYRILCLTELPGPSSEHWEGKMARMIVAAIRLRSAEGEK